MSVLQLCLNPLKSGASMDAMKKIGFMPGVWHGTYACHGHTRLYVGMASVDAMVARDKTPGFGVASVDAMSGRALMPATARGVDGCHERPGAHAGNSSWHVSLPCHAMTFSQSGTTLSIIFLLLLYIYASFAYIHGFLSCLLIRESGNFYIYICFFRFYCLLQYLSRHSNAHSHP